MTGIGIVEAAVIAERERIIKIVGDFWGKAEADQLRELIEEGNK